MAISLNQLPSVQWDESWQGLDLIFGIAELQDGTQTLLEPEAYGVKPKNHVQFPAVEASGSNRSDRFTASNEATLRGGDGNDAFYSFNSTGVEGNNLLIGEGGSDDFYFSPNGDTIIGGSLVSISGHQGEPEFYAVVDEISDRFYIDSAAGSVKPSKIGDFLSNVDYLSVDGKPLAGDWLAVTEQLSAMGIIVNTAPEISPELANLAITLRPGKTEDLSFNSLGSDQDGDPLTLALIDHPEWISTNNNTLVINPPADLTSNDVAEAKLQIGVHDGTAISLKFLPLSFAEPEPTPQPEPEPTFNPVEITNNGFVVINTLSIPQSETLIISSSDFAESAQPVFELSGGVTSTFSLSIDFQNVVASSTPINTSQSTDGGGTVASNAPQGLTLAFDGVYLNSGAGSDSITGSQHRDFTRAGAGDDIIDTGAGDDLVRSGAGNDQITLGSGKDILYFTADQLDQSIDTITDFNSAEDSIALGENLKFSLVGNTATFITEVDGLERSSQLIFSGLDTVSEEWFTFS